MQEGARAGQRILVIEDDTFFRGDLVLCLESEGYEVEACGAGLEAIELAHQHSFDLVVSDIRMAGMDGLDTLERLQQQQPLVATLVITGFSAEADSIRAVRLGVGDYLKKPFGLDEFLKAVARQLNIQRIRKQRIQREQSLDRMANWGLEAWLSSFPDGAAAVGQGRLAERVAAEMGLAPPQCGQARRLALVSAGLARRPELDCSGLPGDVLSGLSELRGDDESAGLLARITLAASRAQPPQDELLAGAYRRAQQGLGGVAGEGARQAARRRLGQLHLARAHEREGLLSEALPLYTELTAADSPPDRVRVEALLGLMRLSLDDPPGCRSRAQEAVHTARDLNPLLYGLASLEAGLAMASTQQRREALSLFHTARMVGGELAQSILQSKALVALAGHGEAVDPGLLEGAWGTLLSGEAEYEAIESADWLVPCLLRLHLRAPAPGQERLLLRLGRVAAKRLLESAGPGLEAPAKLLLIKALAGSSHPAAQEGLRAFTSDSDGQVRGAAEAALNAGSDQPAAPTLRIYTLGGFEVWRGDERVPDGQFRSWKQRFLLARLAGSPRPIPSERLMDEFWPDDAEGARASLNVGFSHLRRLLRPSQWPVELDYVVRDKGRLALNPSLPAWHDLNEMLQRGAVPESSPHAIESWQQAVRLYRGPYLENCYLEWAMQQRENAEVFILEVLRRLVRTLLQADRAREAADHCARLLELDPCSQDGHLSLMKALLALKRPEAAVRQFEVCRRLLRTELAMEPSIELLEYHQRALLSLP